ncbi:MAG TPA: hypothetical protein VEU33_50610 [Archangium sp.]|nr:hypothetical protein [Archangium sp.]
MGRARYQLTARHRIEQRRCLRKWGLGRVRRARRTRPGSRD